MPDALSAVLVVRLSGFSLIFFFSTHTCVLALLESRSFFLLLLFLSFDVLSGMFALFRNAALSRKSLSFTDHMCALWMEQHEREILSHAYNLRRRKTPQP